MDSLTSGDGRKAVGSPFRPGPDDSLAVEELAVLRALLAVEGIGERRVARGLLEGTSPAELVRRWAPSVRVDGPARAEAQALIERCVRCGTRVLRVGSPTYPARLTHLSDPPPLLYLRGDPAAVATPRGDATARPAVAVVGSRKATAYGRRVAEEMGRALGRAGVIVVSGLALGIDGAAHAGTVEVDGVTVALLGGGTERAQPRAHAALYRQLLRRGAALSEHPPGTVPLPHHFPKRNRMIAALADAVVVVEGTRKSGALITARLALELGRDVWAVPGRIDCATAAGANELLRDGARPVCSLSELVEAYGVDEDEGLAPSEPSGVSELAGRVWAELATDGLPLEGLRGRLRPPPPPSDLLAALTELELSGWVVRTPGPTWLRRVA